MSKLRIPLFVADTHVSTRDIRASTPAIVLSFVLPVFRTRHNRRKTKTKLCSPRRNVVTHWPIAWFRFASSGATRNEKSSRKGAAANWAMLEANELVSVTLLMGIAVKNTELSRVRTGRLAFSSGGLWIVQMGNVTNRQSSVAARTKGKNTVAKARAIWNSLEIECVLGICFAGSSKLEAILLEDVIALSGLYFCRRRSKLVYRFHLYFEVDSLDI
jgi:hypothetical protein